jgi:hypothetical protein
VRKDWQKAPVTEASVRRDWGEHPKGNVGLRMGGPRRLVALDADGEEGRRALAALEAQYGPLPPAPRNQSGGSGEHRLLQVPDDWPLEDITNSVKKLGPGLDVRAEGGQIVVAPSVHRSGRPYAWLDTPPTPLLPRGWYELMTTEARPERVPERGELEGGGHRPPRPADQGDERVLRRAVAYLATLPPSVEGQGGDAALWAAALAMVRDFGLGASAGARVLLEHFNPRCRPP